MDDAACALTNVTPATLAGVYALLARCAEQTANDDSTTFPDKLADDDDSERPFIRYILRNARAIQQLAALA
jgi:hypothetical protein